MKTKKLKSAAIIACLLVLCLSLSACAWDPGSYYFSSEDLADVVSIELINYDNPDQKHFISWLPDHTSDLKAFDSNKMSRLEVLDESKIADFIDELTQHLVLEKYYAYDSPRSKCIRLRRYHCHH